MEDSTTTTETLELYRELREEGLDNVGIVLQACSAALGPRHPRRSRRCRPNVRLVKGIYVEPPLIAYQDYEEVRSNFVRCLRELLRVGSYVAIATHDQFLLDEGKRLVAEHGLTREQYEFQMLLGVRELAANRLVRRRAPPADLRAVRRALVPLLAPAAPGEPEDRGLRRLGHGEPPVRRRQSVTYRRFFLIRLAQALFALWLVATLVFVMFFVLLPKPERNLFGGKQATPAMVAHTTREFHLRASLPEQYARYLWRLVAHQSAGSPGYAYRDLGAEERPGLADSGVLAREAIPPTLSVVIPTLLLSLGVAALAGRLLARRRWRRIYSVPIYVAGRARARLRRPVPLLLPRLQVGSSPDRQLLQLLRVELPATHAAAPSSGRSTSSSRSPRSRSSSPPCTRGWCARACLGPGPTDRGIGASGSSWRAWRPSTSAP